MSPLAITNIGTHLTQRKLEVVNVITAEVDPILTSQLLQFIRGRLPHFPELVHLRRIRHVKSDPIRLDVVLAPEGADIQFILDKFNLQPKLQAVSKWPPVSKEQFHEWGKLWPLIGRIHTPQTPPPAPDAHEYFQKLAVLLEYRTNDLPIASLAVDPITNEIVAMAMDTRNSSRNPLGHSVMNLAMEVASKELTRRQRRQSLALDGDEEDKYLCQYLDVYTTHEPCIMCSMALVHSRIGRIVYAVDMETGGLKSTYGLHCRKELNWRFEGWKVEGWGVPEVDTSINA